MDVFDRLSMPRGVKPKKHKEWKLIDFEIGKRLGRGKFGKVYVVREKSSGYICAMKVLNKADVMGHHVEKQIAHEIQIQSRVKHRNCVPLLGWFHDKTNVYLLMEYAVGGELYGEVSGGGLTNYKAAKVFIDVVKGIQYLHSKGIAHRDIKPENVMVGSDRALVGDFGWAAYVNNGKRNTLCGTLDYLPPEMVEARTHDERADIWAVGVLLYEMIVGKPPFESAGASETYRAIIKGEYVVPNRMDPLAADLLSKLLVREPSGRLKLEDVLKHPWVVKYGRDDDQ